MPSPDELEQKKRSILLGFSGGLVLSVLGIGLYFLLASQGTLGRIAVLDIPVTKETSQTQLESDIKNKLSSVSFKLESPKGSKTYKPDQLGASYDAAAMAAEAKRLQRHSPWLTRLQWWRTTTVEPKPNINEDTLNTFIGSEATLVTEEPVNATMKVVDGSVEVTADKPGKAYQIPNARDTLLSAVREARSKTITLELATLESPVRSEAVNAIKAKVEKAIGQKITYTIKGEVFSPSKKTIGSWVEPIDLTSKKANLEFNSGSIQEYIDNIASDYVNPPRSEVAMTDPEGNKVVLVRGRDGTDIKDKAEIATETAKALHDTKPYAKTLVVTEAKYTIVSAQEYDKWFVSDITNKRMYAYEKDRLVRTFKISAGAPATPTVIGEYKIYAKVRRQDMRGLNTDGSSYFQANVEWVNYFYESYAIHGNYWRPAWWFGEVNSSHGCIGLQNFDAEWAYNWAPVGTPVITHL